MPKARQTARLYRLTLEREDTSERVASYGRIPEDRIRPILQGLEALLNVAQFKRDVQNLLQRIGL